MGSLRRTRISSVDLKKWRPPHHFFFFFRADGKPVSRTRFLILNKREAFLLKLLLGQIIFHIQPKKKKNPKQEGRAVWLFQTRVHLMKLMSKRRRVWRSCILQALRIQVNVSGVFFVSYFKRKLHNNKILLQQGMTSFSSIFQGTGGWSSMRNWNREKLLWLHASCMYFFLFFFFFFWCFPFCNTPFCNSSWQTSPGENLLKLSTVKFHSENKTRKIIVSVFFFSLTPW